MASLVWGNVICEPVICEQSATSGGALVADLQLCVQGVWIPQAEVLLDICVVDTNTKSYCDCTPMAVLRPVEHDKKQKYSKYCHDCRATFTVCVFACAYACACACVCEATVFSKWIGDMLSTKWKMD